MRVTEDLRERILAQLADPESLQIITSVVKEGRTALELGKELSLPSTTLYRKIAELRECGLVTVDTFEFGPNGKREARFACTFKEIVLRTSREGIELEVIPSARSQEKGWFELFFAKKEDSRSPG
jgi:DNA-binding transcriptional ArsR family regulator